MVIPQLLAGTVFGWLRVRSGIGASVAAHMLVNGMCVLPFVLRRVRAALP